VSRRTSGPRVVSLVPSSTETLVALGADVVACTRFCEQPGIAQVGGTKNPDINAIVRLAPDLVVMDREENRLEDATTITDAGLELFVSDVRSLTDAGRVVAELAARVGRSAPTFEIGEPASAATGHSAFVPIWRRPWMSINANTYGASMLAHLGIGLVTAAAVETYPVVELADIRAARPNLVLVPSEPYVFEDRHLDELDRALRSVDETLPVVRIDGQDLFWWGSRTPAAIVRLRDSLSALPR
jgi:ABC-type Fe3+-hydroxamate transport system substrate-binding protein